MSDVLAEAVVVVARDAPVSALCVLPGVSLNVSQIDGPRPPAVVAPSIWYDAVAVPHMNPSGNSSLDAASGAKEDMMVEEKATVRARARGEREVGGGIWIFTNIQARHRIKVSVTVRVTVQ